MKNLLVIVVASLVSLSVAGYIIYSRNKSRPGKSIVQKAQRHLMAANEGLNAARALPTLPPLQETWVRSSTQLQSCGVTFTAVSINGARGMGAYSGPANAWHGVITGPTGAVLSCMWLAIQAYPLVIDNISVAEDNATINYSILGSLQEKS